jgi:2-octaprenyl-6-methoxyphenol hydroxylase
MTRPSLELRASQHLALTPALQQSIKLLQLSALDLEVADQPRLLAAARERGVEIRHGAGISGVRALARGTTVTLECGETLEAPLLVGADGPGSAVRELLGLGMQTTPYGQTAVVAHLRCERPHGGIARQWFGREGVLAWLPLPGDRISIVWSAPDALAPSLLALESDALAARVRDAGGAALGDLQADSAAAAFALRRLSVPQLAMAGAVLIGDAAHGVHPLAGQGLNLGLQDARQLAAILAARNRLERPGDLAVLRRHERARATDVNAMQLVTGGLKALFAADQPWLRRARNAGLDAVDRLGPIRDLLAARAMR